MVGTASQGSFLMEVFMTRKLLTVAMLSVISVPTLFALGCASDNQAAKPYSLTGSESDKNVNTPHSFQEQVRYSDEKGRFHPEWVGQAGH